MASSSRTTPTPSGSYVSAASATPPWTLQQIHANAANWTLHGDAQLLDIMRGISGNLERRCTATRTNIDTMLLGLDRANLRLENTTNKMLSLKNLQFIEARVQDDIEAGMISVNTTAFTSSNITAGAADTTDNNELMTTVAAVRTAVDNGLSMLNRCYEKVILHLDDDSDADDDDNLNESSVIFRSRNPHQVRPLPHLIGSREWTDKWHVGLVESDDEDDDIEVAHDHTAAAIEEFSSSDDDTISMSVSLPSNVQTASENSDSRRSSRPSPVADHSTADGERIYDILRPQADRPAVSQLSRLEARPSNLFSGSDSDSEVNANDAKIHTNVNPKTIKSSQPNAQRIGVLPTNTMPTPVSRSKTASVKHVDAPAPIFHQHSQQKHQRPPPSMGLFDDEPPELDAPVAAARRPPNLFLEDSDDDDKMLGIANVPVVAPPTSAAIVRTINVPPKVSNLFESTDDSEPEEYVPRPRQTQVPPSVQPTMAKSNISQLFDDSPPDDLFDVLIAKKPTAADTEAKKKSVFDFDEDELFGTGRNVGVPSKKIETKRKSSEDDVVVKKNIFDFDEDELFGTGPNVVVQSKKIETEQKITSVDISIPKNPSAANADVKKKSVFDIDDDDLFGEVEASVHVPGNATTSSQIRTVKHEQVNNVMISDNSTAFDADDNHKNIFDVDEDQLFDKGVVVPNYATNSSRVLEERTIDVMEDDDLFGKLKNKFAEVLSEPKPSAVCVDDIADSTGIQPKKLAAQPQPQPVKKSSDIFDDIFGDAQSEDEFASIFAKAKPSLNVPTSRKSLFDIPDDLDEWEPAKPAIKTPTASLQTAVADDKQVKPISKTHTSMTIGIADKPAISNKPVATSKASTPEQYANFYTTDKSAEIGAKLVEDRRPFVSYLDNDPSSAIEDEWTDVSSEEFARVTIPDSVAAKDSNSRPVTEASVESSGAVIYAETKRNQTETVTVTTLQPESVIQHSLGDKLLNQPAIIEIASSVLIKHQPTSNDVVDKAAEIVMPIVKARIANKNIGQNAVQLEPTPVDAVIETKIKSSAYLFDDEPPEDDFLSVPFKPEVKPTPPQLNAAFFDTLPPDDDNEHFHRYSSTIDQTFGSTLADLPPDDDDTFDIQVSQPSQLARTSAMAMFDDLPPDDELFQVSNVCPTTVTTEKKSFHEDMRDTIVTTEKKVFYEDFEETIVAAVSESHPPPVMARANSHANELKTDAFKEKINRFSLGHSLDCSPELVQRKPNKLNKLKPNCNLQINVAALLPGAKRAPPVAQLSEVEDVSQSDTNEVSSVSTNSREMESSSGLLVGLTKGRARPTLKRNPSTRQGRLNGLGKSCSGIESGHKHYEEDNIVEHKPITSIAELLTSENGTDDVCMVSSKDAAKVADGLANVTAPITEIGNNDEADDWLNIAVPLPASVSTVQSSASNKQTSPAIGLFSDDDSDDLFGATVGKRSLSNKNNESANQPPKVPLPLCTTNVTSSSLFGDTVDDDDDLFGAINRRSQKPTDKPAARPNRLLFGESDSDDDDDNLFGSSKTKNTTRASPKPVSQPDKQVNASGSKMSAADLLKDV